MKRIFTLLIFFGSISLVSETSEQYIHRSEFFFCNFNDGKNYSDLLAEQAPYEDFLKEKGLQYNRINLLPIWDNDAEYDYVMWGNWPSGQDQYKEWGAYMNDYPSWASENDVPPQNVGDCAKGAVSMRFHSVLRLRVPMEDRDERLFTDWRRCKFTEDADVAKLKALYAKQERLAKEFGLGGYGVSLFTPYSKKLNDEVMDYFKKEGFKITSNSYFDIEADYDIGKVDQDYLYNVLSKIDLNGAEALFVSCTALPVLSIIDKLEKKLNTTVLSSNQALIWDTLVKINQNNSIEGFGKLFKEN